MSTTRTAQQVLDEEFLVIRAKVLELAAALDRLQRGPGDVTEDPRMQTIHRAIEFLIGGHPDRAEQVQLFFSRPYEADWRSEFGLLDAGGR